MTYSSRREALGVGNRIAARAMLKASYSTEDEEAKKMYFDKACYAIAGQEGVKIGPLERALRRELLQQKSTLMS